VHTARSLTELGRRLDVSMPIVEAVNRLVNEAGSVDETIGELLAPQAGAELASLI
jgi:glycerol-3-phosphate dehydrogenase